MINEFLHTTTVLVSSHSFIQMVILLWDQHLLRVRFGIRMIEKDIYLERLNAIELRISLPRLT